MNLTDLESQFVAHVAQGKLFDIDDQGSHLAEPEKEIRAEIIRDLYLGGVEHFSNGVLSRVVATQAGIYLQGAIIRGRVNLDGLCGNTFRGLPSLHLTQCEFDGGISACNSAMAELNLDGAIFSTQSTTPQNTPPIHLDNCSIVGSLRISDVRGVEDDEPVWVSARGVRIQGSVSVSKSRFFYQARRVRGIDDKRESALNFSGSTIGGGINSTSGLKCIGGINVADAHIDSDIWLLGCHLIGGEGAALRAQSLQLKGSLIVRPAEDELKKEVVDSITEGSINLYGATISGGVYLSGTKILDHPFQGDPGVHNLSVTMVSANVGSGLQACVWGGMTGQSRTFSTTKKVELSASTIGGSINFNGANIGASSNENQVLYSITAYGTKIEGSLFFSTTNYKDKAYQATAAGAVDFDASKIKGNVNIQNLAIDNTESSWMLFKKVVISGALTIANLKVSKGINFGSIKVEGAAGIGLHRPTLDPFSNAPHVHVQFEQASFNTSLVLHADVITLNLFGAYIAGLVALDVAATGNVSLSRAKLEGDLLLKNFCFLAPPNNKQNTFIHHLNLRGTLVNGNLLLKLPPREDTNDIVITGAKRKELICYPGWKYLEVEVSRASGAWQATYLEAPETSDEYRGVYLCSGGSSIFHTLNENKQLDLSTEEKAKEYLRLFCACTWGDDGAFAVTETAEHLPFDYIDTKEFPSGIQFDKNSIKPIQSLSQKTPVIESDGDERKIPENEVYLFKVHVTYKNALFLAYFSLRKNGHAQMVKDDPVVLFKLETSPEYKAPLRKLNDFFAAMSNFTPDPDKDMRELSKDEFEEVLNDVVDAIHAEISSRGLVDTKVDLGEACINGLDDDDGASWGNDIQLNLVNFSYQNFSKETRYSVEKETLFQRCYFGIREFSANVVRRIAKSIASFGLLHIAKKLMQSKLAMKPPRKKITTLRNRVRQRLKWLELQYPKYTEKNTLLSPRRWLQKTPFVSRFLSAREFQLELFEPQPYTQAAAVFRREGASEPARTIDYVQRKLAGKKHAMYSGWARPFVKLFNGVFDVFSRFGLSPLRTFCWIIFFIAVGGAMVGIANNKGLLIVDATPVVLQAPIDSFGEPGELSYIKRESGWRAGEMLCGDTIEPLLYAADVFIPLLDLRQESRCMIRPINSAVPELKNNEKSSSGTAWDDIKTMAIQVTTSDPNIWRWIQSLYSLLGWVFISLFVFTLTHKLRAQDSSV